MNSICVVIPSYKPEFRLYDLVSELAESVIVSKIIIVDDGSGESYKHIFENISKIKKSVLIKHAVNLGKGSALKTAFNYVLVHENCCGVVTADSDGQHLVEDIISVGNKLLENPDSLVLGCRKFDKKVPLRSALGNKLTALITRILLGADISDTQTGLRGIPYKYLYDFIQITASKYDYEMSMLVESVKKAIDIIQTPINTVYINNNKSSHFNPLLDSLSIYYVFIRHIGNSLATVVIDYFVFMLCYMYSNSLSTSIVCSRVIAGGFNFTTSKYAVFKSNGDIGTELFLYILTLCVTTFISYVMINTLSLYGLNIILSKIIVEVVLFFGIFTFFRIFVFKERTIYKYTDWDKYYQSRITNSPTRLISGIIIISLLNRYTDKIDSIAEIGGGDSCFYKKITDHFKNIKSYTIIDKNEKSINLFLQKYDKKNINTICTDVIQNSCSISESDVVFNVGLIEHFSEEDTALCIKFHFDIVKPNGLVLITYPTPTLSYKIIRKISEKLGMWKFYDERPLYIDEVKSHVLKYGKILTVKNNYFIGLTQQIIVAKSF